MGTPAMLKKDWCQGLFVLECPIIIMAAGTTTSIQSHIMRIIWCHHHIVSSLTRMLMAKTLSYQTTMMVSTPAGRLWLVMSGVGSFVVFMRIKTAITAMGLSDMRSSFQDTHTNIINSCSFTQPNVGLGILRTSTSSVICVAQQQGRTWLENVWIRMSIAMVTTASTV
jgi:hypothetical protein